jgi:hypothetical protein
MDRGDDFRALVQQEMICVLVDQILEDWFCSACPFWVLTVIYQISSQRALKDTGRSNRSQFALITIFSWWIGCNVIEYCEIHPAKKWCKWTLFIMAEVLYHSNCKAHRGSLRFSDFKFAKRQVMTESALLWSPFAVWFDCSFMLSETKMQNLRNYSMKVLFFMDESSMTCAFCVHQFARPARLKQASELRYEDSRFRFSSQGDLKRQVCIWINVPEHPHNNCSTCYYQQQAVLKPLD